MVVYPPRVKQLIDDIRDLNIQGATRVALAGIEVAEIVKNLEAASIEDMQAHVKTALDDLLKARPTEPCLRNAIYLVLSSLAGAKTNEEAIGAAQEAIDTGREHIISARKKIVEVAAEALSKHTSFFTHCHSSTVTQSIAALHSEASKKIVYCTETRPRYQGRKTAAGLAGKGIPVTMAVDSAFPTLMEHASVVLLGADAITSVGRVYNKIGSSIISRAAKRRGLPLYVLTDSWKYATPSFEKGLEIEERPADEVWEERPEGVAIRNPAFDIIDPEFVTGIITELGVSKPEEFASQVYAAYPFLKE